MRKVNYQKMIELLAFVLHCPICSNKYRAERTSIIEAKDSAEGRDNSQMLVHTECEHCKSSVVFSIALDGPEIFSIGMVTDLTAADAIRFRDSEPISADQVLDFHAFLSKFDGDFERIIR